MSTNRSNGNGRQRLENAVKKLVRATQSGPTHIQPTNHFELEVLNQLRTIENSITRLQTTILATIHLTFTHHFNEEELKQLCFDLMINYQDLEGTARQGKIISLIDVMDRNDRLNDLCNAIREYHPNLGK